MSTTDTVRVNVTEQMVADEIASVEFTKMGKKTTVVLVILKSGFELVSYSSCLNQEQYDDNTGKAIALKRIYAKIYDLKNKINGGH